MTFRVALWACVGAAVVVGWMLYARSIFPASPGANPFVWTLTCLTCPIALAHRFPMSFYLVLAANAATYALVGFTVETIRQYRRARTMAH